MLCKRNLSTKQAFGNPSFHSIIITSIWLEHILPCITFVPGFLIILGLKNITVPNENQYLLNMHSGLNLKPVKDMMDAFVK